MQIQLGTKADTKPLAEIKARQWYRMATGPAHTVLVAAIAQDGQLIQLGFGGHTVREWSAIGEDGFRREIHAGDINKPGIGGLTGPVDDLLPLTDEDIRALEAKREQSLLEASRAATSAKAAAAAERASLPAIFPWLVPLAQTPKRSSHAAGAANLNRDLAHAFPGIKFSATSKSYSGGCSISVNWEYGPPGSAVNAICARYETRSFDGMQDLESIRANNHADVFGGAGYVHASRCIPHDTTKPGNGWFDTFLYGMIARELCALQGVEYKADPWQRGLCGARDESGLLDHINTLLAESTFPAGFTLAQFKRVECKPWIEGKGYEGGGNCPWRIVIG